MVRLATLLLLVLPLGLSAPILRADITDPAAPNHLLPSPSESGIPEKISKVEVRKIRREFTLILDQERDRLRADQAKRRKDGEASRKQRKREWDAQEKSAREKFFRENTHGPDRRRYVYDFNDRRKAFYEQLANEERHEKAALAADWKGLKDLQRERLEQVEDHLRRSERPAPSLLRRIE